MITIDLNMPVILKPAGNGGWMILQNGDRTDLLAAFTTPDEMLSELCNIFGQKHHGHSPYMGIPEQTWDVLERWYRQIEGHDGPCVWGDDVHEVRKQIRIAAMKAGLI